MKTKIIQKEIKISAALIQKKNVEAEVVKEIISFVKEDHGTAEKTSPRAGATKKVSKRFLILLHLSTFSIHVKRTSGLATRLSYQNLQD